jgi:hypothetical protein
MALQKTFTAGAKPAAGRWGGIPSAMPQTPKLNVGHEYDVELVAFRETRNPGKGTESFKVEVTVLESNDSRIPVGSPAVVIYSKHGKSLEIGMSKLKATAVAFAGCETDEEYDAKDPTGALIDATFNCTGENLIGEKAHVKVMQGQPIQGSPGEYWPECEWSPVG